MPNGTPDDWEIVDKDGLLVCEMMDEYDRMTSRRKREFFPPFVKVVKKTEKRKKKNAPKKKKNNNYYMWDDERQWITYETIVEDPAAKFRIQRKCHRAFYFIRLFIIYPFTFAAVFIILKGCKMTKTLLEWVDRICSHCGLNEE